MARRVRLEPPIVPPERSTGPWLGPMQPATRRRPDLDVRAARGGEEQRVGDADRPQPVLGVDLRPATLADDPEERVVLGGEGLPLATGSSATSPSKVGAKPRISAGSSCRWRG